MGQSFVSSPDAPGWGGWRRARRGAGAARSPLAAAPQTASAARAARRATPQVELPQPRVLKSRGHELSVKLTCTPATVDMGAPVPVKTYTYNGVVPDTPGNSIPVTR